jgi:major capsid protein
MTDLTINKLNPVVDVAVEKQHVVHIGAAKNTYYRADSISWGTPLQPFSQAQWTVYPPSLDSIMPRCFKIKAFINVVFNRAVDDHLYNALRQWPLHSLIDSISVQINGNNLSDRIGFKIHALSCYGLTDRMTDAEFSTSTLMPDQFMQYGDFAAYGSARNPLGNYGENSHQQTRGGFLPVTNTGGTTLQFELSECIMLSPFLSTEEAQLQEGFTQIQQLNITITWRQDLSLIWSHAVTQPGTVLNSVAVSMYQAPQLHYMVLTPKNIMPRISSQILPYSQMADFPRIQSPLTNGSTAQYISDSFKLTQIPHRMYIFAQESRNTMTYNKSNNFLTLTKFNVFWNNTNDLFSTASQQQLYEMCVENGLCMTYQQFINYRGSVMCVDFAKNMGLEDNEAPGVRGTYTIQVTADYINKTGATMTPEFFVVFVYGGYIKITNNTMETMLGNLTTDMVSFSHANSDIMPRDPTDVYKLGRGSFWSDFKAVINKISRGIGMVAAPLASALPQYAPIINAVSQGAKVAQDLTGGKISYGGMTNGRLVGGRFNMRKLGH